MDISGTTRLLGVIGHPVAHSLSPRMHNAAFAANAAFDADGTEDGADYAYVALDVLPESLESAVNGMAALGFVGFNVTMPHKESIVPLIDDLDGPARISGAVNTVVVRKDGLYGMNTDGSGFVEACSDSGVEFAGKRVLLLGAGGAAAAIAVAVLGEKADGLKISNRTLGRATALAEKVTEIGAATEVTVVPMDDAAKESVEADIIINTTYLGMKGDDKLPIPAEYLDPEKVFCDAVYLRGTETEFIRRAREAGARTVSGERMLLYQGVQAQRVWTGREPNVEVMSSVLAQ